MFLIDGMFDGLVWLSEKIGKRFSERMFITIIIVIIAFAFASFLPKYFVNAWDEHIITPFENAFEFDGNSGLFDSGNDTFNWND